MMQIPDHPDIRAAERTGYPASRATDPATPTCPICGAETDTFYEDLVTGDIVGCAECLRSVDAWERMEVSD